MIRRLLISIIALLVVAVACQRASHSFSGVFAFVDNKGFSSIYELSKQKVIWKSELESPPDSTPSWSPDGRYLIYQCIDTSGTEYVRIIHLSSMSSRSITLVSHGMRLDGPLDWEWSPSGSYVALISPGYPIFEVRIVSIEDADIVCTFTSSSRPIWSHTERHLCYSSWSGASDIAEAHQRLMVVDLETQRQSVALEGGVGQSLTPIEWADDDALIYRCSTESGDWVRDTKGTEYPNSGEYQRYYAPTRASERPPEAMCSNLKIGGWSKNAKGEWLISRAREGQPLVIEVFVEGDEKGVSVVEGRSPIWRP